MLPPLELHDPITHAFEESCIARTCPWCKLSLFISVSCRSQSKVCVCFTAACSVTQHRDKSTDHMSCTCTHLCLVDTFKHEVCLYSLLYLSWLLVCTKRFLKEQAFTNKGQPMWGWLHWKYHFMWSNPCTISLGVWEVFAFGCLLAWLFAYLLCMFVCLLACLLTRFSFTLFLFVCFFLFIG